MLTFFALHLAGDPTYLYVSERATEEEVAATRAKLGFDKPLYEQKCSALFEHVYESYPERDGGVYADVG